METIYIRNGNDIPVPVAKARTFTAAMNRAYNIGKELQDDYMSNTTSVPGTILRTKMDGVSPNAYIVTLFAPDNNANFKDTNIYITVGRNIE